MKTFAMILVLLALGVPAFAAESAPPPVQLQPSFLSCPSAPAGMALNSQASVLPAELTAKPLFRSDDLESLFRLGSAEQSCADFCAQVCGGCCYYDFRGPGTCDCC